MTEDEIVGWHHQLDGHELEQAPGVSGGQRSLVCCSPWSCKESDMTEWVNLTDNFWVSVLGCVYDFLENIGQVLSNKGFTIWWCRLTKKKKKRKCFCSILHKDKYEGLFCGSLQENMEVKRTRKHGNYPESDALFLLLASFVIQIILLPSLGPPVTWLIPMQM